MRRIHVLAFLCFWTLFLFFSPSFPGQSPPTEWADEYNKLARAIYEKESQPLGNPVAPPFDDFMYWMGEKAKDRDKIESLIVELTGLNNKKPENKAISDWLIRFHELLNQAQESGNATTGRAMSHMRIEGVGWSTALMYAQKMHSLYDKARQTRFAPDSVREFAQCLIRYASRDFECSFDGLGLYKGCAEPGRGVIDQRDGLSLDERCPRRQSNVEKASDPQIPADEGLKLADTIRNECDRWGFAQERSDVTDIMEDYYEDVLCVFPPKKGHKWYLDKAKEYDLDKAIDHNEGFYATIKGKVEILTDEGKKPAPGAKVKVYAPLDDREWTTTADSNADYEIKEVILHKDCSPFEISAEYEGHEEETEYEGPLEEPDESYEFTKDLLIKPYWKGMIESTGKIVTKGGESIAGLALGEGESQALLYWKMDVVFKPDRGNDRVKIYKLKSAGFTFLDEVEYNAFWQKPEGKMQTTGRDAAQIKGRDLSGSECDLELIIDIKKKTYKIEGILFVENIPEKIKQDIDVDFHPIHGGEKITDDATIDYKEDILLEGEFSEDFPWVLEGSLDEMEALPSEFVEFMEAMAGKISGKIRWKLDRKGK
jgi:hypothetical protein